MENCNRCKSEKIKISYENKYYDVFECSDCNYITNKKINECCRNPNEIVTIEHRQDNLIRLYYQCLNCGGAFRSKPLNHKTYSDKIRNEFNVTKYNDWENERKFENKVLREFIDQNNYKTSKYAIYIEYLTSIEWKIKREKVFERDKNLCQKCKIKSAEQVHHITYDNLCNEPLEDLISVCVNCHTEIHRILKIEEMKKIRAQIETKSKSI